MEDQERAKGLLGVAKEGCDVGCFVLGLVEFSLPAMTTKAPSWSWWVRVLQTAACR